MKDCPYRADLATLAPLVSAMLHDLVQPLLSPDNPYGLILTFYCKECDCAHTSVYAANGESSMHRAQVACVAAAKKLHEATHEKEESHGKTHASKSN